MIDAIRHQSITKYSTIFYAPKSTQIHPSNFCSPLHTQVSTLQHDKLCLSIRGSHHYSKVGHVGQKSAPAKMNVST